MSAINDIIAAFQFARRFIGCLALLVLGAIGGIGLAIGMAVR